LTATLMTAASTPTPRPGLMDLSDALGQLLAQATTLSESETVPTVDADGRVLSQDIVSGLQVPPHDNSSMDGYAVRSADISSSGAILTVTQRIPAGHHGKALNAGEAARIFTGAPIPPGADAVVMQEHVSTLPQAHADAMSQIQLSTQPSKSQWIRRSGEDVSRGSTVLQKGHRLNPASLGLAASIGLAKLQVVRKPRVALFSTGDELVMPGDVLPSDMAPGAIYNSNRFFLLALLRRLGCEVTDLGIVPDRFDLTVAALQTAAADHDLILTSGGVSVGEEDHVKPAVQSLGQLDLWQIAMKPGKPFAYGQVRQGERSAHFVGLPGNPVSSFVTFLLLVRPLLLSLQGVPFTEPPHCAMPVHFDLPQADRRREFLRVRRNAQGGLDLYPNQSSGVLTSAVWADGLIDHPAGKTLRQGDIVNYLSFADLLA